jgi:hypothetical protein
MEAGDRVCPRNHETNSWVIDRRRPAETEDTWIFLLEMPKHLIKHLPDRRKRYLCLHILTHFGAKVIGNPVWWRYVEKYKDICYDKEDTGLDVPENNERDGVIIPDANE